VPASHAPHCRVGVAATPRVGRRRASRETPSLSRLSLFDSVVIKVHQERAESDTAARAAGMETTSGIRRHVRRVASTPASAANLGAAFSRRAGAAPLRDWQSRCAADGLARAGGTSRRRPSSVTSCGRLACEQGRRGAVRDARGGDPKGGRGRGTIARSHPARTSARPGR